jgi:hypothetical protein
MIFCCLVSTITVRDTALSFDVEETAFLKNQVGESEHCQEVVPYARELGLGQVPGLARDVALSQSGRLTSLPLAV